MPRTVKVKKPKVKKTVQHHLLVVYGDVDPFVYGPYPSDDARYEDAKLRREEEGDGNGMYCLDIIISADGTVRPEISAFCGGDFE